MESTGGGVNILKQKPDGLRRFFEVKQEVSEIAQEVEVAVKELGANSIRIAGDHVEDAITTAKICLERGVSPWLSPRFGGTFEETKRRFGDYVEASLANGLGDQTLIVANELVFDNSNTLGTTLSRAESRHTEVHRRIADGERPDVTEKVNELVKIARKLGWKGPLTYAAFAYETVRWEDINDDELIVSANLYWEMDQNTGQAKPPEHYRERIKSLIRSAKGRSVAITEFGAVPHKEALAAGGGGFMLDGEVDYDAQAAAIQEYTSVLAEFPEISTFAYAFHEPKNKGRVGSFALIDKVKDQIVVTAAGNILKKFHEMRSNTNKHGVEIVS